MLIRCGFWTFWISNLVQICSIACRCRHRCSPGWYHPRETQGEDVSDCQWSAPSTLGAKSKDAEDALAMLKQLQGRDHQAGWSGADGIWQRLSFSGQVLFFSPEQDSLLKGLFQKEKREGTLMDAVACRRSFATDKKCRHTSCWNLNVYFIEYKMERIFGVLRYDYEPVFQQHILYFEFFRGVFRVYEFQYKCNLKIHIFLWQNDLCRCKVCKKIQK